MSKSVAKGKKDRSHGYLREKIRTFNVIEERRKKVKPIISKQYVRRKSKFFFFQ